MFKKVEMLNFEKGGQNWKREDLKKNGKNNKSINKQESHVVEFKETAQNSQIAQIFG
jgi:hypothetical protein